MKIKRYKKIRKILHAYAISHHIVPPYKIAVDGEFLQSALIGQIMLKEQLPKMLQEERTTAYVTPCIDNWLKLKGPAYSGALHIASKLSHLKCRHDKGFVRPFDCIKHLVANGNPDRLLIGAQDEPIRKLVRHTAGVPLLFIHGSTVIMESPTDSTKDAHAAAIEVQSSLVAKEVKQKVRQAEIELNKEKKQEQGSTKKKTQPPPKKKRKGPSQPNPLSMKKKKNLPTPANSTKKKTDNSSSSSTAVPASASNHSSSSSSSDQQPKKKQKGEGGAAVSTVSAASSASSSSSKPASNKENHKKRAREEQDD